MTPLFGLVFAILATVLCWAAVTVTRAARGWLAARALRRRGDGDTVEIVRRRPLVDLAGHVVLVLMLAVPAAVLAGGGALPGPSGGGGGLPITGGTMTGTATFVPGAIVSVNAGGQIISTANPTSGALTDSSIHANPTACGASEILVGAGVNNTRVFSADCEGDVVGQSYNTLTNCSDGAGAAACASASAGSVVVGDGATTVVVSTTAVTANSQIFVEYDSSLGTKLGVTCNTAIVQPTVSARTAAASFTITISADPAGANPACLSYFLVN
jgi:hypothetical protein